MIRGAHGGMHRDTHEGIRMITRRKFLSQSALGLAGLTAAWTTPAQAANAVTTFGHFRHAHLGHLPILQGWTTETETEIKVMRPKSQRYHYQVRSSDGQDLAVEVQEEFSLSRLSADSIDHLKVTGLSLEKRYQLLIHDEYRCLDIREFSALDLKKTSARIAILSCMQDVFWVAQKLMWAAVARSEPDLLLFIGDACYADFNSDSSPGDIWRRHCESRRTLDVYRLKKLIPSFSVWDDHDFGLNDGDGTFRNKVDSLRIFDGLFGSFSQDRHFRGPAACRIAYAFGLRIALMDDRYFRSPSRSPGGTHWGEDQENFLAEHLGTETRPTLLCNGNQFFGGYQGKESYERDHPESFSRTMKRLASVESPILFCSGDVHYSEVMKIEEKVLGYTAWELTSSSVHSLTFPWTPYKKHNPRRTKCSWHHNFLLLQTDTALSNPTRLDFHVKSIGKFASHFHLRETIMRSSK